MNEKSSIDKLDEQIKMLSTKNFVKKDKTIKRETFVKERKVIIEEPTKDSLMSDLMSTDDSTKVFDKDKTLEVKKVDEEDVEDEVSEEEEKTVDKFYDIYLPIFIIILIIILILLIIFI